MSHKNKQIKKRTSSGKFIINCISYNKQKKTHYLLLFYFLFGNFYAHNKISRDPNRYIYHKKGYLPVKDVVVLLLAPSNCRELLQHQ